MSQVIRVPSAVYSRLESHARGFDTPANVIERILNHYEGVHDNPLENDLSKEKVDEEFNVTIKRILYRIEKQFSGTIRVLDKNSQKYITKVKPFLKVVIDELELDVDLLNSSGNEKNTRQLGKEIIAVMQGKAPTNIGAGKNEAKVNLPKLIQSGFLDEGQTLLLHDYKGERIDGYEATISGKGLLWEGEPFSMSALAKTLLQVEGYNSNSVRGTQRWYTSSGISVLELWQQYLNNKTTKKR